MTSTTLTWSTPRALTPINANAVPQRSGVYLFSDKAGVFYVGESGNLHERIATHASGSENSCVAHAVRLGATFRYAIVAGEANRKRVEQQLIMRHNPRCNRTR